jgi:hypothetical protein
MQWAVSEQMELIASRGQQGWHFNLDS